MSIQLVIANIALETTTLSRQDFGSVLHAAKHNYWPERVKTFTSVQSAVDGGVPVNSVLYNTLTAAFAQEVKVPFIKVARHEVDETYTPETPTDGKQYSITLDALQSDAKDAVTAMSAGKVITLEGVSASDEAVDVLGGISDRIVDITDRNTQVATATEEQSTVVHTINQNIEEINAINEVTTGTAEQLAEASQELRDLSSRLDKMVGSFKL